MFLGSLSDGSCLTNAFCTFDSDEPGATFALMSTTELRSTRVISGGAGDQLIDVKSPRWTICPFCARIGIARELGELGLVLDRIDDLDLLEAVGRLELRRDRAAERRARRGRRRRRC